MDRIPKWVLAVAAYKVLSVSFPSWSELKDFATLALSGTAEETYYEELLNSLTHGIATLGAIVSMYFIIVLAIHYRHSWHHWLGLTVYGVCLVALYAFSTIYHVAGLVYQNDKEAMYLYRMLDHIGIFYQIAGSYTPLVLLVMIKQAGHKISGYLLLGFVWLCARTCPPLIDSANAGLDPHLSLSWFKPKSNTLLLVVGTIVKLIVHIEDAPMWVHASFYLFMGFSIVFAFKPMVHACPSVILFYLGLGGFFFSAGVVFLLWDSLHFNHGIWHLFVIAGSVSHYVAIMLATLPHMHKVTPYYTFQSAPQKVKGAIEKLIAETFDGLENENKNATSKLL